MNLNSKSNYLNLNISNNFQTKYIYNSALTVSMEALGSHLMDGHSLAVQQSWATNNRLPEQFYPKI